jgi:RHS repeat-associated protein
MALTTVISLRPAVGSPGDILTTPAPAIGADPPKAADIKHGDASVSTQTGALQYSYPISVPPGRQGMAPQLTLSYSSQAPTHGGIASGWTLGIPVITEDWGNGRLHTRSPEVEQKQVADGKDPKVDDRFVSSMAGGHRLILVTEPTGVASDVYLAYRGANDSSYARYERMQTPSPFRWRMRTIDGKVMTFGEAARMPGCYVSDYYAPLTGMVDPFGNEVRYEYQQMAWGECRIKTITWGQNITAGATLPDFARVVFSYRIGSPCNGVYPNSQIDYRSGVKIMSGAGILATISATAYAPGNPAAVVHTRTVELFYDETGSEFCSGVNHAPVRLLTGIRESGSGVDSPSVTLPTLTFEYNNPGVTLDPPDDGTTQPWGTTNDRQNLGWGYRRQDDRWATVEAMFLDVDGDGLQDYVRSKSSDAVAIGQCTAEWWRNRGTGANGQLLPFALQPGDIALPRLKWRGPDLQQPTAGSSVAGRSSPYHEGCALNGQVTAFKNSNQQTPGWCHSPDPANPMSCHAAADPMDSHFYCGTGGTDCPFDPGGVPNGVFRTYLAYRWLDMDSDGLPDLVAAVHGDIDTYDVERGNLPGYEGGEPPLPGIPGVGQWPSCNFSLNEPCKDVLSCLNDARTCDASGCTVNWALVATCVSNSASTGCANVIAKGVPGPDGAPPASPLQRWPYQRCEGKYPWLIYKNLGQGQFATSPTIKYQPIPLESSSGDSNFTGPKITSQNHSLTDFDGDGWLDALLRRESGGSGAWDWWIWLGDGTGGFQGKRYLFPTRDFNCPAPCSLPGDNAISGIGGFWGTTVLNSAGLIDANGDGAQDHWLQGPNSNADIAFNDGVRLRLFGASIPRHGDVLTTPPSAPLVTQPGSDSFVQVTDPTPPVGAGAQINAASTTTRTRVADVDQDGRPDIVSFGAPNQVPQVFFNVGGNFATPGVAYPGDINGVMRLSTACNQTSQAAACSINPNIHENRWWALNADLMDLDGDGIQESVFFDTNNLLRRGVAQEAQPSRMLKAIHNGRGGHWAVTYSHMHDASTVEQHPEQTWWDGRPKASPRAGWVVKSLAEQDDYANTNATSGFYYKNPRFGADDENHFAFRGFEEVTTTNPGLDGSASGARTIQRFDYSVDWSGRQTESVAMPKATEGASDARTIDVTQFQSFSLFNSALITFQPTVTAHYVCLNGQNETTCKSSPAAKTVTTSTWTAYPTTATTEDDVLWVESNRLEQAPGSNPVIADRQTVTTYQLDQGAAKYILRSLSTTQQHLVNSTMVTYAKSASTWDSTYGFKITDEVWVDAVDSNRSITRFDTDPFTGNVVFEWNPVQWAANPNPFTNLVRTSYSYDSRKLFIATETSPPPTPSAPSHVRNYVWEYGTGTRLQTLGPNVPSCALSNPPTCPAGEPLKEDHRIRVDGLGRMIQRFESFGSDGNIYRNFLVETNAYVDGPQPSITRQSAYEYDEYQPAVHYRVERTDLDGHARPLVHTVFVSGSAPADEITRYAYANDGTLATVTLPDPSANNAATVTYTYTFDSLGRPTSIRRPDAASAAQQSGADVTYNGLTETTTEVVPATPTQAASTIARHDAYGRLVEVQEKRANPSTWATTGYSYDPANNMTRITDAEGAVTQLTHDMAGRRTAITRAAKTWRFGYDKNGNMTSEQTPCTPVGTCEVNYTSTIAYDALDRPISKVNAPRNLTSADQTLFGSATEAFSYDTGPNGVGQMTWWKTYPPSSNTPTTVITPSYNVRGQVENLDQQTNATVGTYLTRSFRRFYALGGQPYATYYRDIVGTQNCTNGSYSQTYFDARGLPSQVVMYGCLYEPQSNFRYISNARNVAGNVTRQYSVQGSNEPFTYVESNWTYDKVGRVTSQLVNKGSPLVQVAKQDLHYLGNDNPDTLDHWLGASNVKHFTYTYDLRHQLTNVAETGNAFTATYGYRVGGRFDAATESAAALPNSNVKARSVTYVYSASDPEQLITLKKSNNKAFASYTYDLAGNQITRDYPDTKEHWDFVYDGKNQLRRATKKVNGAVSGSEEYWYDDNGTRMLVVKRNNAGAKTGMIWFIGDTEAHYDATNTVTRAFGHVMFGTTAFRMDRDSDGPSNGEYQFHGLGNNTLASVENATGTINASFVYAPFGEVIEATNAGGTADGLASHKRRMNDKFIDDIDDLAYYGARYYDRTSMTWTQGDPFYRVAPDAAWGQPRRASLYMMSLNNPMCYADPDGLGVLNTVGAWVKGSAEATADFVEGGLPWNMTKAVVHAAEHPVDSKEALGNWAIANAKDVISNDPQKTARGLNNFASLFLGEVMPGAAPKSSKVSETAPISDAAPVADAAAVSDAAKVSADAAATKGVDLQAIADAAREPLKGTIADTNRTITINEHASGKLSATGSVKPTPAQRAILDQHGVTDVPKHGKGLVGEGAKGHHGEARGIEHGKRIGDPVVRQASSSGAKHGGKACASCDARQKAAGVKNPTGVQKH